MHPASRTPTHARGVPTGPKSPFHAAFSFRAVSTGDALAPPAGKTVCRRQHRLGVKTRIDPIYRAFRCRRMATAPLPTARPTPAPPRLPLRARGHSRPPGETTPTSPGRVSTAMDSPNGDSPVVGGKPAPTVPPSVMGRHLPALTCRRLATFFPILINRLGISPGKLSVFSDDLPNGRGKRRRLAGFAVLARLLHPIWADRPEPGKPRCQPSVGRQRREAESDDIDELMTSPPSSPQELCNRRPSPVLFCPQHGQARAGGVRAGSRGAVVAKHFPGRDTTIRLYVHTQGVAAATMHTGGAA